MIYFRYLISKILIEMNELLKALKCVDCHKVLATPVCLPCGHLICKSHADSADEQVICCKCGVQHKNQTFPIVEPIVDMINAQIDRIDFGHEHKMTVESCDKLKREIDKNGSTLNDMENFIHESIGSLKNRILVRSEELKNQIQELTNDIIVDLENYETRCKNNCKEFAKTGDFSALTKELSEKNNEAKESWENWSKILNDVKVDIEKWKNIKDDCERQFSTLRKISSEFEDNLLLKELRIRNLKEENFEKANIDPVLIKSLRLVHIIYS